MVHLDRREWSPAAESYKKLNTVTFPEGPFLVPGFDKLWSVQGVIVHQGFSACNGPHCYYVRGSPGDAGKAKEFQLTDANSDITTVQHEDGFHRRIKYEGSKKTVNLSFAQVHANANRVS